MGLGITGKERNMTATAEQLKQADFGVLGIAVMGENLAMNIEDHGFSVAVCNLRSDRVTPFMKKNEGKKFIGAHNLQDFVKALKPPRRVMLMVKAGDPVDDAIKLLKPLLSKGDIIIDGGNSWFKDTQRREAELTKEGFYFFGAGVSGGEEGARFGPSIMPGGSAQAYEFVRPVFEAISAKTNSGPCVTHVGPDGAGHFVKMVHNGIEYGDMQLIAEAYDILRKVLGLGAAQLADIFTEWNKGILDSFLIELTAKVFTVKDDETGRPLVDMILDEAGQKGTGKWTAQTALDMGIQIPTIAAALDGRGMSSIKEERVSASKQIKGPAIAFKEDKKQLIGAVGFALYDSKVCSYTQGMRLIKAASDEYKWNVNLKEMARIWKGGCIIRAKLLDEIMKAYDRNPNLPSLLLDDSFKKQLESTQADWRRVVSVAVANGIPTPAMSASLAYFDSYRTADLPQNLTQAQRDFFGAHTYQRVDHPERGFIHTDWLTKAK
jgi:6-phosphogluconate dehydrogenase